MGSWLRAVGYKWLRARVWARVLEPRQRYLKLLDEHVDGLVAPVAIAGDDAIEDLGDTW